MLEAFQSLQDKFSSFQKTSKQPEVEVDQTSASASKPGSSNQAVTLDPPPPRPWPHTQLRLWRWTMIPPCHHVSVLINLNMSTHRISIQVYPMNLLGWHRLGLKSILTHKKHDIEPRSASDQYSGQSDELRVASSRPKKHADRSKHKVRSRYGTALL